MKVILTMRADKPGKIAPAGLAGRTPIIRSARAAPERVRVCKQMWRRHSSSAGFVLRIKQ